jgi:hypothetical protein
LRRDRKVTQPGIVQIQRPVQVPEGLVELTRGTVEQLRSRTKDPAPPASDLYELTLTRESPAG